ncbi:MAG: Hpt domain-containing protein [Rhizomicrobium sp.]
MSKSVADAEVVPASMIPPLLSEARSRQAMSQLKNGETLAKANRMLALKSGEMRGAVLALVGQVEREAAGGDWPAVQATSHEIRGLAGSAGLDATGRIANVLYQYLDAMAGRKAAPDAAIGGLHIDALLRSAGTARDAAQHGDAVARELSLLVARKLAEIKK